MKISAKPHPRKPALVIMGRAPRPGQVKTRLCPPLTLSQSSRLYECFLQDMFGALTNRENWELWLAVPRGCEDYFQARFTQRAGLLSQRGRSLGDRMHHIFVDLFRRNYRQVVIAGSDLPTLPVAFFDRACAGLAKKDTDAVLGPALDGGYYLIGMKQPRRGLFRGIEWSGASVLADTLARADRLKLRVKLLPPAYDIDGAEDLARLRRDLARLAELRRRAPRTHAFLKTLAAG